MAPHLTTKELDYIFDLSKNRAKYGGAAAVHAKLVALRARSGLAAPGVEVVRRALAGETHRRGRTETRGRKRKLTAANSRTVNKVRRQLIKDANGEQEVTWNAVLKKARVPDVHRTTAARSLKADGFDVEWRPAREKPLRDGKSKQERADICSKWKRYPAKRFTDIDLIIDNKKFDIPRNPRAVRYSKMRRVRGHLRTRAEGLEAGFTKPKGNKHRVNPGATVSVCAGISKCKAPQRVLARRCIGMHTHGHARVR